MEEIKKNKLEPWSLIYILQQNAQTLTQLKDSKCTVAVSLAKFVFTLGTPWRLRPRARSDVRMTESPTSTRASFTASPSVRSCSSSSTCTIMAPKTIVGNYNQLSIY